ncbi:uncharacterized protein [Parasteatoda tepidariorum]|uniref:uncharacterized protein n=1 Tax=Parasteatoda tepidariorum TaxID=114398 RepID=UPI0039BC3384
MKTYFFGFSVLSAFLITYGYEVNFHLDENRDGCQCWANTCGCCLRIVAPKIGLNDTACVNLTYLPQDLGISFTVTIDKLTIYNKTISAKNPPPICFAVPTFKQAVLCLRFYDLDVTRTKLHGCLMIEAILYHILVGEFKIGCFNLVESRWNIYHKELLHRIREKNKIVDKK